MTVVDARIVVPGVLSLADYVTLFDLSALDLVSVTPTSILYLFGAAANLSYPDMAFTLALSAFPSVDGQVGLLEDRVRDLCRIAQEVRIFPLLDREGAVLPEFGPILLWLQAHNYGIEVRQVTDPAGMPGAMLRIWAKVCDV